MSPEFEAWMQRLEQWVAAFPADDKPLSAGSVAVYRSMWRALGRTLPLTSIPPELLTESQVGLTLDQLKLDVQPRRRYLQLLSRVLGESSAASHLLVQDPPPPRRLPVILTQSRERELTDHLPNCTQRQQLLVALVLGAGLRAGEVAQVRWSDLRLDDPALPWLVARRRSGEPIRSTPIAPWAVPYLQAALPVESAREAYVFANERGLPVAASTLWRDCEALVSQVLGPSRLAGMTRLRNTYGVRNLANGKPLPEVQEWLGHHQESTTARLLSFIPPRQGAV